MNWEQLEKEKIEARFKLNQLNPQLAQENVNAVLKRHLWQLEEDQTTDWDDSMEEPTKYTPNEIEHILRTLQIIDANIILVGGQAINFWAIEYQTARPELSRYLPFSSLDIDFLGGRLEAAIAHEALGGQLTLNRDFSPSPNAGVLLINLDDQQLRIDFLATVFGLNEEEIISTAQIYRGKKELREIEIKVLNPILCLEGKLNSTIRLPQQGRQDLKHLKMSVLIVNCYLENLCRTKKPRIGLKLIERIYRLAERDAGLQAWLQHRVEIDQAIPIETISLLDNDKWQSFREIRLPQLQSRLVQRRDQYREIFG